jgi:hypothetical protein
MTAALRLRFGRGERGQASVELLGMVPWLLVAGLLAWQLLLTAYTAVSVGNAARTASRVESRGGDAVEAGRLALPGILEGDAMVEIDGEETSVTANVPILIPGIESDRISITKGATFPGS